MSAPLETRHVEAIVALAEELNFTRAASRLNLTQPTLSRQIDQAETLLGFLICDRDSRGVAFTEAGKIVAEECRRAKHHLRLAQHRGMTAHEGTEHLLLVGHSPWIDRALLALVFEIKLPQFPRLKIELRSDVAPSLTRNLLEGEIQVAIMTEPAQNEALILTALSNSPIYAVFPAEHPAAEKSGISLADFALDAWAILRESADPEHYSRFQEHARASRLRPKELHQILTPHEAGCLVGGRLAVAFLPAGFAEQVLIPGAVCRPLIDDSLRIGTCTALRRSDDSKLANAFIENLIQDADPGSTAPAGADHLKALSFLFSQQSRALTLRSSLVTTQYIDVVTEAKSCDPRKFFLDLWIRDPIKIERPDKTCCEP